MNSRYQSGGDIYSRLEQQYGTAGADKVAAADASGEPYAINQALTDLKYGAALNDSTISNFVDQVTTDPLAAPLDAANKQIGNAVTGIFKSPWVLAVLLGVVFYAVGGFDWVKRKVASA